jgi:hypothetical protein
LGLVVFQMSRWFRFYAEAMRNPKVAKLSDFEFRLWVELLCLAAENDGKIPCANDLKGMLKRRLDHLLRGLNGLIRHGLIDALGDHYEPHNWGKFQYKSDTSTERVTLHRKKRNVSVTAPDTETDTETDLLDKSNKGAYAFSGEVIRLNHSDFGQWAKSFKRLDLMPLLQSRDDWLRTQDSTARKNWYKSTSSWLAAKSKDAVPAANGGEWQRPIC